jgi:hypothetical protein
MTHALRSEGFDMASNPASPKTGSRETLWAIIGSLVFAIILATLMTGNPFSSLSRAYTDYPQEPRGGGPAAAPAPVGAPAPAPAAPK